MRLPQSEPRGLPRLYVSRPRLLHRMSQAVECKLTVLCADAGYGKTTLVAEFGASAGFQVVWYHLERADRDITRLAEGLEQCLRRLASEAELEPGRRGRVRPRVEPSVSVLSDLLLRQAARIGPDTVLLILDDYHNVDEEGDANLLLSTLVENSPACLHFVMLSRSVPRLPLGRLRARQELSILREDELAFTLEETSRFLRSESDLDLDDAAVALVHERTEGWAAGIAMVSQSLRYGRQEKVMEVLADPAASAWLVYDYLAEEVFDRQESALQDFLTKTSILETLTAPVCDYLLGSGSSQLTLLTLEERGLFTTSVGPSKQAFRYHQLFRETLRQKLYHRETREAVDALHLRAAQYHEQEGAWEQCVHHCLKAGRSMKAAEVIEAIGESYIYSGFFQTVDRWLKALPEDLSSTRPWLLVLRGLLSHLMAGNDESLRLLERALRLFQASGDECGQSWTAGQIGYVKYRMSQLQSSFHHFASALAMAGSDAMLRSELLVMQAQVFRDAGELEKSEEGCRASLAELASVEDGPKRRRGVSRAHRNLGLTQMEMGDLQAALDSVRGAHAFCTAHQIGEYEEGWALAHLGAVLWARGDLEEAIQVLNRALSLAGRYIKFQRHIIGLWLGNSLRDSGRYAEAERAYEHSVQAGELERIFTAVVARRAVAVRAAAADLYRRRHSSESLVVRSTAEIVLAAVLRECQDPARALEHVREGVRLLRTHGFRLRLSSALLHQARIEYDLWRQAEARESLSQALELAAASGYYHFFWWDPELVAFLCQKALAEDIVAEHAAELVARSLGGRGPAVLAPLLHDRRGDVRRRAHAVLSALPQRRPTGPEEAALAGCSDLKVRGVLAQAIADRLISPEGVQSLHASRGLSWREVEILVEYYLRPAASPVAGNAQLRKECAERLSISENTVRCHVNNIRSKLALPSWALGARVLEWAEAEGLLPPREPAGLLTLDS